MPEISKKKHLLPSFCKYLLTISHKKKDKKKHPLKDAFFRGCMRLFFYLLALVLLQGTLKHIKKRQAHFTVIESQATV